MSWSRHVIGVLFLIAGIGLAGAAAAQQRVALVIGNSAYQDGYLANPAGDAELISDKLRAVGFDVTTVVDADENTMERAIIDYTFKLQDATRDAVGVFYYAGHGIESNGENYLIPIGHRITRRADLGAEGIRANWVMEQLEAAGNRINFVILDACRNNPLPQSIFRSSGTGLAEMKAPVGTFVGFSTTPGTTAADGEGDHSPYATALADVIETPNLPAELVFKRVRDRVISSTGGIQVPWDQTSLAGEDFFFVSSSTTTTSTDGTTTRTDTTVVGRDADVGGDRIEMAFWDSIKDSTNAADFAAYVDRYPDGAFSPIARNRLAALNPGDARSTLPSRPADLIVDASGGGDYATIQEAVIAAADGDIIHVRSGVYREDVSFTEDKRLTLLGLGSGAGRPTIAAGEYRPIEVMSGNPIIENFQIEGDKENYAAIYIVGGQPKFKDNDISTSQNACVWVEGYATPVFSGNQIGPCATWGVHMNENSGGIFEGNTIENAGYNTILVWGVAVPTFLNNEVRNSGLAIETEDTNASGIWIDEDAAPTFVDNTIVQSESKGAEIFGAARPTFQRNSFTGGLRGVIFGGTTSGRFEENTVTRTEEQALLVYETATPTVIGNQFSQVRGHCVHYNNQASGVFENNTMTSCGLPPTFASVHLGEETTVTFVNNVLNGPGMTEIVDMSGTVDMAANEINP